MAALQNLGMRIQETISEHTRDFTLGKSPSAAYFDTGEDKVQKIRRQLDSTHERDVLEGMKRLIALISKGRNVAEFFAQVVKNVSSHNLEIRKLVYIYLLRYADAEPDLALLSINTFQKDLSDSNPLMRAMALRVLSGIRVPMIGSIVVLGIKKCASDPSPYVRKAAALAIPKAYNLDSSHLSSLMPILTGLLRDRSPLSIGAVAVAFNAVCPTRLDLLHQEYRRLCRILADCDEWGQVHLIDLLSRYARAMLSSPTDNLADMDPDLRLLLDRIEPLFQSHNPAVTMAIVRTFYYLAPPSLKPKIINPLLNLMHRSPEIERVVLGNCLIMSRDHPDLLRRHIPRFFVRTTDITETKRLKLQVLMNLVDDGNADTLIDEFKEYASDVDEALVEDAIHAIGKCARLLPSTSDRCLRVLMDFIKSQHSTTISYAILVIKSLYQYQAPAPDTKIIASLARRFDTITHPLARASVLWLIGQYAASPADQKTVVEGIADWAPDVLRKVAKTFADESDPVRLAALTLSAKLVALSPSSAVIRLLSEYLFAQARYDVNYDVRDRGRTLAALMKGVCPTLEGDSTDSKQDEDEDEEMDVWERRDRLRRETAASIGTGGVILRVEQVRMVLFGGKGVSENERAGGLSKGLGTLGTVGILLDEGKSMYGDHDRRFTEEWNNDGTDSSLRDSPDDAVPAAPPLQALSSSSAGRQPVVLTPTTVSSTPKSHSQRAPPVTAPEPEPKTGKWKDLDAFYADESSEEEKSDNTEEEGDEEEEEEGEEEEEEEEDDEEEEEEEEQDEENVKEDTEDEGEKTREAVTSERGKSLTPDIVPGTRSGLMGFEHEDTEENRWR